MLGVIGGSGVYQIEGLEGARWVAVPSPWGAPSDEILTGRLAGLDVAFLPRHGRGHRLPPGAINYRANIDALKRLGVTELVSLSACGSLRADLPPGTFCIVDQYIDRTFAREKSFFGPGLVAHVSLAQPVCDPLSSLAAAAAAVVGVPFRKGGTYLAMEGPQFSTRAESQLYRSWGCDVIGMTNMPEAKLAREAELCYASVAMVTDYDCWHDAHEAVEVSAIIQVLLANADAGRALVLALAPLLVQRGSRPCPQGCGHALEHAMITNPTARDPALAAKLDAVAGRLLGRPS